MPSLSDLLSLRAGGAPWLMRHELRLFVADSAAAIGRALQRAPNRRAMPGPILGWIATVYLILHLAAWGALPTLPYWRPSDSVGQLHLDGAAAAVLFVLMLSAAMLRCVHVLHGRNDLDLLLSSPLPAATILRARLGGVILGTLLLVLFLVTPVVHVGLCTGRPRLLALYPGLLALAAVAASVGMALVLQLSRWIGPRYTAMVAQVPGTVVIVALYFLPRLQQSIPAGVKATLSHLLDDGAILGPASPLWLPVRALQGHPLPLALFCLAAFGLAQLATLLLQHDFLRSLQQGRGARRSRPSLAFGLRLRFGQDLRSLVLHKEWLLVLRHPLSLSQLAAKLVWPVVALVAAGTSSQRPLVIAAIVVYGTAALAGTLTRLIECGEPAADLLACAPVAPATIGTAKRRAALIPALLLGLPALVWLGGATPKLGWLAAVAMAGACASACRLNRLAATPMASGARDGAAAPPLMTSLKEVLSNILWVLMLIVAYAILD